MLLLTYDINRSRLRYVNQFCNFRDTKLQVKAGYDLKKIIQDSVFMHWSTNNKQIYKAFIELLDKGLATNVVKHQESSPTKQSIQ